MQAAERRQPNGLGSSVAAGSRLRSRGVMQTLSRMARGVWGTRRCRYAVAFGLVVALGAGTAYAERITGQLAGFEYLRNPVWTEAKDPSKHGYTFREVVPTVPAKFRALFPHIPKEICVAALAGTQQSPKPAVLVRVGGGRTTPVTIVVTPKTKLTFRNTDPFTHRLYAVGLKTFEPNDTARGAEREWTVPEAGAFEIRDELAPSLRMFVVAKPDVAAIAYPSMDGKFALTVKEPGDYKVQAFFAGEAIGPQLPITVEGRDVTIQGPIRVAKPQKKKGKK